MRGRDLKAEAVRANVPLYQLGAAVQINPNKLSRLLNDRDPVDRETEARIRAAIERLAGAAEAVS
jgi:hypothetical protein